MTQRTTNDIAAYVMEKYKGSIQKRGKDCFDVRVYHPPTKNTLRIGYNRSGERIRSKTEALQVLTEVNSAIQNHTFDPILYQRVSSLRFGEAIKLRWEKKKEEYSPTSRKEYHNRIHKLIIPEFKGCDVRDITYDMIEAFREKLSKTRSEKTVTNILAIIKAFYREQKKRGITPPVFPEVKLGDEIDRGWCEWDAFIEVVNEIPSAMDQEFVITTRLEWLRPGETRALIWKDFDWENDILTVSKAFSLTELKHTKTKKVARKPIHPMVREMLLPRKGHPEGYVFMRNNKPYSESWMRKQWNIAARSKNLDLTLYEATRHSAASVAASDLHNIYVISETLGHSDVRTTQRYANVNMKAKKSVMEKTEGRVMPLSAHKKVSG